MNKMELEKFKKSNENLRVLNVVEALFQEDDLELSLYVFYEDELGVNAKEILVDQVFEKWEDSNYEDKEEIIREEIGWWVESDRKDFLLNNREDEDQETDYVGGLMCRMVDLHEILVGILYIEPEKFTEDDITDYIRELTKDKNANTIEVYKAILKRFGVDEKELKDLVLRIGEPSSV